MDDSYQAAVAAVMSVFGATHVVSHECGMRHRPDGSVSRHYVFGIYAATGPTVQIAFVAFFDGLPSPVEVLARLQEDAASKRAEAREQLEAIARAS